MISWTTFKHANKHGYNNSEVKVFADTKPTAHQNKADEQFIRSTFLYFFITQNMNAAV